MDFIRFCVRRKVTVGMFTATVFLFGLMSWLKLDREFMPELQFPQLVVLTSYPNASSQEVENLVTKVVEEAAGTVKNVHRIHSSSREGISIVTVEFLWGTGMDVASLNLREKVDLAKAKLPRDAGEPRIEKFNPFALPVITLSLSGDRPDHELLSLARRPVAELLEKTRGVAAVTLTGGREREIQVEADQSKLTARSLPILEVGQAIARANVTYPAGNVKDKTFDYVVRVVGAFETVPDLGRVPVAVDRTRLSSGASPQEARRRKRQGPSERIAPQPIFLSDVAEVRDAFAEDQSFSRYDGRPTIALSVLKQAEANVVHVADDVRDNLDDVRSKLPPDVRLDVTYDQSVFVKAGIRGMVRDSLLGGVLAFLVLVAFLGNWKDAVVVSLAIPVSILMALSVMYGKGMSLNTITLAGLAIGIGHLVDGAIVVQENIARHRALGEGPEDAAVRGAHEVFGAVASSIATSVAVFFPLVFVKGVIGQVFRDLSYAVIFSQGLSLIVAFTLIPMLSAQGKGGEAHVEGLESLGRRARGWVAWYDKLLDRTLADPKKVLIWAGGLLAAAVLALAFMSKAVFPEVEGNQLLLRLDMPMGTSLEATDAASRRVEDILDTFHADVEHRSVTVGSQSQEGLSPLGANQARIILDLRKRRPHRTDKLIELLKDRFSRADLGRARLLFLKQGGTFSFLGGQGAPVVVEVKGHDLERLEAVSRDLSDRLRKVKGLYNVRTSLAEPAPELKLEVRRDALANVSLSVSDLAETVLTAVKGKTVSKFREAGKEVDIKLRLRPQDRADIGAIQTLYVHSPLDVEVPLGAVADVRQGQGPSEILRYDQQRTVLVSADLSGRSVASAAAEIDPLLDGVRLKEKDVSLALTGESARMAESFNSLKVVLALSILFVFMIMASQFESLLQPFIILFTIPLALIGVPPALLLTGHKLTAMAGMGMVLLAGIVVNNGIVLVDFVNQSLQGGMPLREALKAGCHTRLRPILMTAITTILGMLPLAFGIGEGADMQAPMAVVVVSGLLVSTLLTLVVLPALFVYFREEVPALAGRLRAASPETP